LYGLTIVSIWDHHIYVRKSTISNFATLERQQGRNIIFAHY
jgi:hypothetical protein